MRKKILSYVLFLFIFFQCFYTNAQSLYWATQFSGDGYTKLLNAISVDEEGNIYGVGNFSGTVDFDPGPGVLSYNSGGYNSANIFITKQTRAGKLVWAKQISSGKINTAVAARVNPAGYIDIFGTFRGTVDFDPGPGVNNLTADDNGNMYILRLNTNGDFIWAKQIGTIGNSLTSGTMTTDNAGNIILTCTFGGITVDFDPGPGVFNIAGINSDLGIVKLSATGDFLWAKEINSQSGQYTRSASAMKTDAAGNIYMSGYFSGEADFDPGTGTHTLNTVGSIDGFLSKLNPDGDLIWVKQFGYTLSNANANSLALDAAGNAYILGFFDDNIEVDPVNGNYHFVTAGDRDIFMTKISTDGDIKWAFKFGSNLGDGGGPIEIDKEGNLVVAVSFKSQIDADPGTAVKSMISKGDFDIALLQFTTDGKLLSSKQIGGSGPDDARDMVIDSTGNIIFSGTFSNTVDFDPGPATFNLSSVGNYPYSDLFIACFAKANSITGKTFNDVNGDGTRQSTEPYLSNVLLSATRNGINYYAITDTNGVYKMEADTGSYVLSPFLPLYYTSIIPESYNINFGAGFGQSAAGYDFALKPSSMIKDIRVSITSFSAVRRGALTTYRITVTNKGTDTVSGSFILTHDKTLNFENAQPSPANYSKPFASWTFSNLAPSMSQNTDVQFRVSPSDTLGQILKSYVTVNPVEGDFDPGNNTDSLYQVVISSFDPNDKSVKPDGPISPDFVSSGKYLDYTIRFQNVGTDTAFNIVVTDTLSNNADINSFEMLSSSHNYSLGIKKNGVLEWEFNNILLPDSNRNEPRSHGFVRYRIKAKNSLTVGDQVKNKAAIYFDFNQPVLTNETVTTVELIKPGNPDPGVEPVESKVFPNPVHNTSLIIQAKGNFNYRLYDITGQVFRIGEKNYDQAELNVAGLAAGIYILQIKADKGTVLYKIVVQ